MQTLNQKNPRAHKNKIGTSAPLQKNPAENEEFYGHGVYQQKEQKMPDAHKIVEQPFPAPELRAEKLRDMRLFEKPFF